MTLRSVAKAGLRRLPPQGPRSLLHGFGRFAPWEAGFDFTPPDLEPGEETGPPDFVGIGVQKAGTTWWYRLLTAHPGVSSRPGIHKERHFLSRCFRHRIIRPAGNRGVPRLVPPPSRHPGRGVDARLPRLPVGAPSDVRGCPRGPAPADGPGPGGETALGPWPTSGATAGPLPVPALSMPSGAASTIGRSHSGSPTSTRRSSSFCNTNVVLKIRPANWRGVTASSGSTTTSSPPICAVPWDRRPKPKSTSRRTPSGVWSSAYRPDVDALATQIAELDLALWPNFAPRPLP